MRIQASILIAILMVMNISSPALSQTARAFTLIGHRGAAAVTPENTLVSLRKAMALGVDRIEIDVHMTRDGRIVLMHDRTLERTTTGHGAVRDHDLAEIQMLDAGSWFDPSFAGEKAPTLEEAIEAIDGKCMLMIEVKEHGGYTPGIELAVAEIIRKYNAGSWCVVISLRHKVVANFHRLAPDIRLHRSYVGKLPLIPVYIANGLTLRGLKYYDYVEEFNLNKGFISRCILRKAMRMNKKINAWTDDQPDHAMKLVKRGVSGIITNAPAEHLNAGAKNQ
jgi:glycerophosphoryl diester phosphodiesterase